MTWDNIFIKNINASSKHWSLRGSGSLLRKKLKQIQFCSQLQGKRDKI